MRASHVTLTGCERHIPTNTANVGQEDTHVSLHRRLLLAHRRASALVRVRNDRALGAYTRHRNDTVSVALDTVSWRDDIWRSACLDAAPASRSEPGVTRARTPSALVTHRK